MESRFGHVAKAFPRRSPDVAADACEAAARTRRWKVMRERRYILIQLGRDRNCVAFRENRNEKASYVDDARNAIGFESDECQTCRRATKNRYSKTVVEGETLSSMSQNRSSNAICHMLYACENHSYHHTYHISLLIILRIHTSIAERKLFTTASLFLHLQTLHICPRKTANGRIVKQIWT